MRSLNRLLMAAAATALLGGTALAQQSQPGSTGPAPAASMPPTSGSAMKGSSENQGGKGQGPAMALSHNAADMEFMRDMKTMQKQMSEVQMTGNPDQDFVSMMIPHHQGAINMARVELKYGKSRYLKKMAKKIISSQTREIKKMSKWQSRHPS